MTLLDTSTQQPRQIELDRVAFDLRLGRIGRNDGPALLFDLYLSRTLDLSRPDMAGVVADIWSSAEYPLRALSAADWVYFFQRNGYSHDGHAADRPAKPVVLYRGCARAARFGMSWTSDVEMARRFAYGGLRGREPGQVYTATVAPEHLLAYIGDRSRGESEYVVAREGLRGRRRVILLDEAAL